MTPRKTDYRERKDIVLAIVVDQYIQTISRVSSAFIAQQFPIDLSSATVRNILAELEDEGYLTHPHTSAGRMPTQNGYRYYVDHLMHQIQLLEEEKARIKAECQHEMSELECLLEKTSEVVSAMTNYTSIISVDGSRDKIFCRGTSRVVRYPESQDLMKIQYILNALEEKGRILEIINRDLNNKIQIYIGQELACFEINDCSLVVSGYKTSQGASGRIAVLGPTRMNYSRVVSTVDYFSELINEIA